MKILVINGPNLNMLGKREPEVYGTETLAEIEKHLSAGCPAVDFTFFQSNHEGAIVDLLQRAFDGDWDGIVMNPGAFTHYSYAIRDAVAMLHIPVIEVHLSNIYLREDFRKQSVIAPVCAAQVSGLGPAGYRTAVEMIIERASRQQAKS